MLGRATLLVSLLALACGGSSDRDGGSGTDGGDGSSGSGGGAGADGGADCDPGCLAEGFACCGTTCVNLNNDPHNCGSCGNACPTPNPYCDNGKCGTPMCFNTQPCDSAEPCCGDACCSGLCCSVPGPIAVELHCVDPTTSGGTCPLGCLTCKCADPDTPIATPSGMRPIDSLRAGDWVYSIHRQAIVAVPVLRTNRTPVHDHRVLEIVLESGAVLAISGGHPTADGRRLDALGAGDMLGEAKIASVRSVAYAKPYTVDVLPDSDSGAYFAAGAAIGSTLSSVRTATR